MEDDMSGTPLPEIESCVFCDEPAVIRTGDPKRPFCPAHFCSYVEERVLQNINEYRMISAGDRIAVGLSGGKDSTALILLLHEILSIWHDVSLTVITIDEGITGYRDDTIHAAEKLTKYLGLEHRIISFSDMFGEDLDTLLRGRENQSCTVCGVLRRRALSRAAGLAGATKLATGHNLDDEAQSVLMNVLRGDLPRLIQDTSSGDQEYFIPRIKPLSSLPEKEIAIYLLIRGVFPSLPECPYARFALRSEVRSILDDLEYHQPGVKNRLIKMRDEIRARSVAIKREGKLRICAICGDFCSGEICKVCKIRSMGSR
jgi:uncharacterized protein (TIGR00269 family)